MDEKETYEENNKRIIKLYNERNELKKDDDYTINVKSINDEISRLTNSVMDYEKEYELKIKKYIEAIGIQKAENMKKIVDINEKIISNYTQIKDIGKIDNISDANKIIDLCSEAEKKEKEKVNINYIDVLFNNDIKNLENDLSNFEYNKNINYDIRNNLLDKYITIKFSEKPVDKKVVKTFDDKTKNLQEILNQQNAILEFQTSIKEGKKQKDDENYKILKNKIKNLQKLQIENRKSDESTVLDEQLKILNNVKSEDKEVVEEIKNNINKRIEKINEKKKYIKIDDWISKGYLKETLGAGDCFYSAIFRGLRDIKKKNNENKVTIYGFDINFDENEKKQMMKLRQIVKSNLPTDEYVKEFDEKEYNNLQILKTVILNEGNWAGGIEKETMRKILKDYLNINLFSFDNKENIDNYNIDDLDNLYLYNPNNAIHFQYFFNDNIKRDGKRRSKRKSLKRRSKRKSLKRRSKRQSLKRKSKRKSLKRRSKRKSLKRRSKRKSLKRRSKRKIDL
jgi:hypothetical protein